MSASGCPCRASVLSYFHLCLSRLVFPCPVTGVLVGCSTSWQKGSLRPIAPNRCICLHGCGPFSPLQTGRLVPARDRCVGSLRCRNRPECRSSWFVCRRSRHASFGFRLVRSWGNCQCVSLYGGCRVPRPAGYSSEVHRYVPTCRRCPRLSREYWALYVP